MPHPSDGGRKRCGRTQDPDCSERRMPYLVRMIGPNPIDISRLARSTNLSKIRESPPPERRPFGSRPRPEGLSVPELDAHCRISAPHSSHRHFGANLLKLSNFQLQVKVNRRLPNRFPQLGVAQRKISKTDQPKSQAARARGIFSRVMQWLVLCGILQQGLGASKETHPTQRTGLPFPMPGRTEVHREAPLLIVQLSKSSTGYPALQPGIHPIATFREYQPVRVNARIIVLWKPANSVGNR